MTDAPNETLLIGATSSLATAVAHQLAGRGTPLILAGRDADELARMAADLATRYGTTCRTLTLDFAADPFDASPLTPFLSSIVTAYMFAGEMGGDARDPGNVARVIRATFNAPAILLSALANAMEERRAGTLVIISSVAGDRGRQSNYAYGSAKAGLTAFAGGLRNRLHKSGVHVLTVKPGFVDTPMTYGMESPLIASREKVARAILLAVKKKKDMLYTPWFWRYVMLVIRLIPECIFKRLSL